MGQNQGVREYFDYTVARDNRKACRLLGAGDAALLMALFTEEKVDCRHDQFCVGASLTNPREADPGARPVNSPCYRLRPVSTEEHGFSVKDK